MVIDISLLSQPENVFWLALGIIVVAIVILTVVERRMKKKIAEEKEMMKNSLKWRISVLKKEKVPENFLIGLDGLVKEFFWKKLGMIREVSYSDARNFFEKKRNTIGVNFCEEMEKELYSGQKVDKKKLELLVNEFERLIKKYDKSQVKKSRKLRVTEWFDKVEDIAKEKFNSGAKTIKKWKMKEKVGKIEEETKKAFEFLADSSKKTGRRFVPFIKEKIKVGKIKYPKTEPIIYESIKSIDDLDRIAKKLEEKKLLLLLKGHRAGESHGLI